MKHVETQTIETERLILRKYEMTDAEDMFRNWVADPEASRFWSWAPHKDILEAKSLLSGWIKEYSKLDIYHWVIVLKSTSQAIGYIYFDEIDNDARSLSVHCLISRKLWNQGIATEACKSVLEFAFNTIGASKVHSRHHIENPASGKVLRKCGMGYVSTEYRHYPDCKRISGNYHIYEITRHIDKS
jgi:ribosomal-protein-alanine N-acetyltransferase